MIRLVILLVLLCGSILGTGYGDEGNTSPGAKKLSPLETAKGFMEPWLQRKNRADLEKAVTYCTKKAGKGWRAFVNRNQEGEFISLTPAEKIEYGEEKVDGESATVRVTWSEWGFPRRIMTLQDITLHLEKEDGKWGIVGIQPKGGNLNRFDTQEFLDRFYDGTNEEEPKDRLVINLTQEGEIWIDEQKYNSGSPALVRKLQEEAQSDPGSNGASEREVLIQADRKTEYKHIEKILKAIVAKDIRMYKILFGAREGKSGKEGARHDRSETEESWKERIRSEYGGGLPGIFVYLINQRPKNHLKIRIESSNSEPDSARGWEFQLPSFQTKDPKRLYRHIFRAILRRPRMTVVIAPSSETPYEIVLEALIVCVEAKVNDISFGIYAIHADKPVVSTAWGQEELDLRGPETTDEVVAEKLKGLTKLKELDLGGTGVTDAGLVHLKGLTKLKELDLSFTKITDAGLIHLKGHTKLESLVLSNTYVTDAGLVHLKGLTNLERLYLDGTQVTDAGIQDLQRALPNCKIWH
jgi:hypothetical protein